MNVLDPNRAIYCSSRHGPIFGCFIMKEGLKLLYGDIRVADNINVNTDNISFLDDAYKHLSYFVGAKETNSFLAGTHTFQIEEIEVYQKRN
jgi:hypothetical protein